MAKSENPVEKMAKSEKPVEKMETSGGKKRVRQRKLNLYENIRRQMEFYFSTPNLQKDRFLKKLVMSDPEGYVDIETFLTFNKIKALTTDVTFIVKAIKESKALQVDETCKRVGRKVKFEEPQDTDDRTVYVEFLPRGVTIDWLIGRFSRAGEVVHVSLPKYKSTGDAKGFAFVEFSSVDGARKACELLNCPPEKLSTTQPGIFAKTFKAGRHMQKAPVPDSAEAMEATESKEATEGKKDDEAEHGTEVVKVAAEGGKDGEGAEERSSRSHVDDGLLSSAAADEEKTTKKKKKRKRSESREVVNEVATAVEKEKSTGNAQQQETVPKKKKKLKHDKVESGPKGESEPSTEEVTKEMVGMELSGVCSETEKSPAKKKSGRKNKPSEGAAVHEGLRVISKKEWLEYRQDYYQRHKQSQATLKNKIKEIKTNHRWAEEPERPEPEPRLRSELAENPGEVVGKEEGLTFVPNVIIKVTLSEPVSKKFLKEFMSESGDVAFLDMNDGDLTAHSRCPTSEAAAAILKSSSEEIKYELLQGEEEKSYWNKVFSDREKRVNSKSKKKKARGKDRVALKADRVLDSIRQGEAKEGKLNAKKAVHVVFDD